MRNFKYFLKYIFPHLIYISAIVHFHYSLSSLNRELRNYKRHDHDLEYAQQYHSHSYAEEDHDHSQFDYWFNHDHDGEYAPSWHFH